ncbi:ABC transporter ATP-binding protein [Oceanidesulfovibrio marinus]|uniref:ABC transporter n=1 Tax=Oceanidesulfovibrio marinus TaxID=370038 RepID=A0A6P1ZCE5_9BACT|nr:ABC transporter ATP-binding protein [Oceanidesulfovibrio marinus]QJT10827.1 ABC transporter ATP-binding protein [Oceanidesulfovibrio marinus]TVM31867.1 ABC transporter [Oceanidesulfovibrio marinus]
MGLVLKDVDRVVDQEIYLKDINLALESGSRYVVLGRTLAGKTTLLRVMAGLDRPTNKGSVLVDGTNVTGQSVRKRNVAMVYQQFINYPSLSVYKNIASPLRGIPKAEVDQRVRHAASILHIEHLLDRLPVELSGGQQQRTAIARALVKDTGLLLLDEPLVNLDYKLREELRQELLSIFTKRESIVVYTTTEPSEALMLGGNIIVMHEGRILQTGPTTEVYQKPSTTKVAEVFSDPPINFIHADVGEGEAQLRIGIRFPLTGHLKDLPPGPYTFGVRSHHFSINKHTEEDIEIASTVELAEINGSQTFVHFHYRNRSLVLEEEGVHPYRVGSLIHVYVQPRYFYVFDDTGHLTKAPDLD